VVYSSTVSLSRCRTLSTTISSRSRRQHRFLPSRVKTPSTTATSHLRYLVLVLKSPHFVHLSRFDPLSFPHPLPRSRVQSQARSASPISPSSSTLRQPTTSRGPFRHPSGPRPTAYALRSATGPFLPLQRPRRLPVFPTPRSASRLLTLSGRTPRTTSLTLRLLLRLHLALLPRLSVPPARSAHILRCPHALFVLAVIVLLH